ncbi:hypothetical protein CKO18_17690 [Rhodoferax fermentans]|nr:hypothetical protein [Rhodoferax fermentans]
MTANALPAANAPKFEPPALADPAFFAWAIRVGLRLANKPPGTPAGAVERAILMEGTPCPEWAQGLAFLMSMANAHNRETRGV